MLQNYWRKLSVEEIGQDFFFFFGGNRQCRKAITHFWRKMDLPKPIDSTSSCNDSKNE